MMPIRNIGRKMAFIVDERADEVHQAEPFVEPPAGDLREPVIDGGEEREHRARRHQVVEVADDVVGVVQDEVARPEPERQAGHAAQAEHRQEGQREAHRRRVADGAAPQRDDERRDEDDRRHRHGHGRDLEEAAERGAHAREQHVVRPHQHRPGAQGDDRAHHQAVAPQRAPRVRRDDFRHDAHRRQDEHVDLGMREEPEEVLPEQRIAAARDGQRRVAHGQPRRQEEARADDAVHQLEDGRRLQRRKRQQQQQRRHHLRPHEEGQAHQRQARRPVGDHRGHETDGAEHRRHAEQQDADQPHRLARRGEDGQRRIRRPARVGRAARQEEAAGHQHAGRQVHEIAGGAEPRKRQAGGADLQRHEIRRRARRRPSARPPGRSSPSRAWPRAGSRTPAAGCRRGRWSRRRSPSRSESAAPATPAASGRAASAGSPPP